MDWDTRVAELWASFDRHSADESVAAINELANERPEDDPAAAFGRASALDSTGRSDLAVPRYRRALELGLSGIRRRRAVIQMSSSLMDLRTGQLSSVATCGAMMRV